MKRNATLAFVLAALAGCRSTVPPEVLREYETRALVTCCNLHYEGEGINDANYYVGTLLPLGTPVFVERVSSDSITFRAGAATRLTLRHAYGTQQETARQYFDKVLVPTDPNARLATFPKDVQVAIRNARLLRGMGKGQVILALGYPPTHRTPTLEMNEWTYWYNRWNSYKVIFDEDGLVAGVSDTGSRWSPLGSATNP